MIELSKVELVEFKVQVDLDKYPNEVRVAVCDLLDNDPQTIISEEDGCYVYATFHLGVVDAQFSLLSGRTKVLNAVNQCIAQYKERVFHAWA